MDEKRIKTDVLCVGAGIAGLMAGIRAAEKGAKVALAEKGHALHSGRGRGGNDHSWCYIPEVHGDDVDYFMHIPFIHLPQSPRRPQSFSFKYSSLVL